MFRRTGKRAAFFRDLQQAMREAGSKEEIAAKKSGSPLSCPSSVLFVPGINEKAMKKVAENQIRPDCIILDLEDAIPASRKAEARDMVVEKVSQGVFDDKRVVVRINSPSFDPKEGLLDLEAMSMISNRIEGIAFPKTTLEDCQMLKEDALGLHPDLEFWAFFETPKSIIDAPAILGSKQWKYAVMGTNDLAAELQRPHDALYPEVAGELEVELNPTMRLFPRLPLHFHLSTVVNAARAFGVHPIDGVFNDPSDTNGFLREAREGRALSFSGKTLIHPNQISPCHEAFSPSPKEVTWAKRIVSGVKKALLIKAHEEEEDQETISRLQASVDDIQDVPPSGVFDGVISVEGKMVESMHYDHAVRVLSRVTEHTEHTEGQQTDHEVETVRSKSKREGTASIRRREGLSPSIVE